MTSDRPAHGAYVVSRERLTLTLALPYVLLFGASLVAWPWLAFGLPVAGTIAPPSVIFLAAAVAASLYAVRCRLPMGMITWVPVGQGAIALLGTGFLPPGADPLVGLGVIIVAYGIVFLLLLGLAMAVAGHGVHLAVAMVAFFIMTQATRFPIFEAEPEPVRAASFLTLAAALRALIEIGVIAWLATRLVTSPPEHTRTWLLALVGVTLAHGVLASWEDPLRLGQLTVAEVGGRILWWVMLSSIGLGMVTVLARLRRSWFDEPAPAAAPDSDDQVPTDERTEPLEEQALPEPRAAREGRRGGGRPTPRKRRRR